MNENELRNAIKQELTQTLQGTEFTGLGTYYHGKVRDNYIVGDKRIIVVSDRLSAFDKVLTTIPFKGQVLNQLAAFWFEKTKHMAPNHVVALPDPNVTVARECKLIAAEFVMRAYLTGVTSTSIWVAYDKGARKFCGHDLPDGMRRHQKLPKAILTPSTKAEQGGHDVSVSRDELLAMGEISPELFARCEELAHKLFAFGQEWAAQRGLILVDTKYEFGLSPEGEIVVIDEIHTPDSSRYWYADDYEARMTAGQEPRGLDKEYVRRYLADTGYLGDGPIPQIPDEVRAEAALRYIKNFELVSGSEFRPTTGDPLTRIKKNLSTYLGKPL